MKDNENGCIVTLLTLNAPFISVKQLLRVTNPRTGYFDDFRQRGLSENSQHRRMWRDAGLNVYPIDDVREPRGCSINDIKMEYADETHTILKYESADKPEANEKYFKKKGIRAGLHKLGLHVVSHNCVPLKPKKTNANEKECLKDPNTLHV